MNRLRLNPSRILALFILLTFAVFAVAQTSNGTLAGVVSDPQGAVIQNATVTVTNTATGETHTVTSNSQGAYRVESVGTGNYTVTVKASGFSDLKIQNVVVAGSITTTANAKMKIGATETVTVDAVGQMLHTEDGTISHNISNKELTSLPLPGGSLNPISLVLTQPGVIQNTQGGFSNGFGFSNDGSRPRSNNFLIEGQDNNDNSIQGQAIQVTNLEATKEVNVLTNSYGAEFGHGGGSVTNLVYKSGTNTWHGSAWDLLQNSALDTANANDKFFGSPKAQFTQNTYGYTIGGPIKKDKLFIFGSEQWNKTRQSNNGSSKTLPSAAGFSALQALPATPTLTRYLQAIGNLRGTTNLGPVQLSQPGRPASIEAGNIERSGVAEPSNNRQDVIKGDWLPTSNDTLTLRYTRTQNTLTPDFFNFPGQLPGFDTEQGGTGHNAGITYVHVFNPQVVNELRVSYGRIGFSFAQTAETLANPIANGPSVTLVSLSGYGVPTNIPQGRFHNTYQYQDSVSWQMGNHSFKFGADVARILVRDAIPFNFRGSLNYNGNGGTNPATDLDNLIDDFGGTSNQGAAGNITFGNPTARPKYVFQNYFFQDTWKMRSNFTVTYGMRYENTGTPENFMAFPAVDPVQGVNDPNFFTTGIPQQGDNNNFAPRLSFAYTPRFWTSLFGQDKTVIRAGYGIYYDNLFTNIVDNTFGSSPNAAAKSLTSAVTATNTRGIPNFSNAFSTISQAPAQTDTVTSILSNLVNPLTHQWNLDIERELPGKFTLTTSYIGTRGIRLYANDVLNFLVNGTKVNPARGSWTVRDNAGDSFYHAFTAKLDRRFTHGFLLRTAYTFGKNISTADEVFNFGSTITTPGDVHPGNRGFDKGLSGYNVAHRVVVTYIYDIPKLQASNMGMRALGYVTNGWEISGIAAYQTGSPANVVVTNKDLNGDGFGNDRPSLANPLANPWDFAIDGSLVNSPGLICDGATWVIRTRCSTFLNGTSNATFTTGTPITVGPNGNVHWFYAPGNAGPVARNFQVAPGRQDYTFGLQRTINLWKERHQLQIRMEMLNPLNHPNTGNATFNLSNVRQFLSTTNPPPVQTIANYTRTLTGERDIRFWLKYQF